MDSHPQSCQLESVVLSDGDGDGDGDGGGGAAAPDRVSSDANGNGSSCLDATPGVDYVNVDDTRTGGGDGVLVDPLRHSSSSSPPKSPASPSTVKSPLEGSTPRSASKGFGLRKWRRIRRDVAKEASVHSDSSKPLKRGAPTSFGANRPTGSKGADLRHNSEDSVGSVNMPINPGAVPDALLTDYGSNSESRLFVAGVDSENSDDRSSRSSTAASAPRQRYDLPTVVKEKSKVKMTSGKKVGGTPVLQVPQGKGRLEGSKKARGERIKVETENSHSSVESDSRSSNFVFMQGAFSVTSNGNKSRVSMTYGGENGDEARAEEREFSEEVQTNYNQGDDGENEDPLRDDLAVDASWDKTEDNGGTGQPSADCDPLVESIRNLQSLHEVLETEVHRFGELGRGNIVSRGFNPEVDEPSKSRQFDSQINGQSTSLEPQVVGLTEKVKELETRLEDANNKLKAKESDATAGADWAPKKEPVDGELEELGSEVEDLYKQKIEVEVEYLALVKSMQKLKVAVGDPVTLLNEQKALAGEQVEVINKLGKAEGKAALLKEQAEELQKYYGDILQTEEVVKMERRVCKVTSCFLIQLILLVWVVWLLLMQLYPQSGIVVPT